jgi:hypothetical protein
MPTLDDTPILENLGDSGIDTGTGGDLVLIYDVSEQKIKAVTFEDFATQLP